MAIELCCSSDCVTIWTIIVNAPVHRGRGLPTRRIARQIRDSRFDMDSTLQEGALSYHAVRFRRHVVSKACKQEHNLGAERYQSLKVGMCQYEQQNNLLVIRECADEITVDRFWWDKLIRQVH
jgi:hypothetical protein